MNSQPTVVQLFIILATLLAEGCSLASWQRVGYETVQNVKEQQCQKQLPRDKEGECQQRENYDTYQKRRNELPKTE
jgi:hypothetical protein